MMRPFSRSNALVPAPARRAPAALLLLGMILTLLGGCTSGEKGARPSVTKPVEEVFESFDSGAVIEEETIAPPPSVAPPPVLGGYGAPAGAAGVVEPPIPGVPIPEERERVRERPSLPLSSPGAAPAGAAPPQPGDLE